MERIAEPDHDMSSYHRAMFDAAIDELRAPASTLLGTQRLPSDQAIEQALQRC